MNRMMKRTGRMKWLALLLCSVLLVSGCAQAQDLLDVLMSMEPSEETAELSETQEPTQKEEKETDVQSLPLDAYVFDAALYQEELSQADVSGVECYTLNEDVPLFTVLPESETSFEWYGDLDELGRCTGAVANIGPDLMPDTDRESISSVKPSGYVQKKYEFVNGGYLYNRCHLIAYCLTGENANEKNLITGTRAMNEAMIPLETSVAKYVETTGNHVFYRSTPIYEGTHLVADGVIVEAWSLEDDGAGISFCRYLPNEQDGVTIDYATGESWEAQEDTPTWTYPSDTQVFIGNMKSGKFHTESCSGAAKIAESNKKTFTSRQEALDAGLEPCGICHP